MIRPLVLAPAVLLLAVSAANAQIVYDTSPNYGLSNAGIPAGPYAKLGGGYSMSAGSNFNNSYVVGGGLGYRFFPFFRSDVTFDYRPDFNYKPFGNASFKNWSAMLNGYVDFNLPFMRPLIP